MTMLRCSAAVMLAAFLVTTSTRAEVVEAPSQRANVDQAASALLTAHGLLDRGLFDLAATEYRAFLADHSEHPEVNTAHYGLSVCLYQTQAFNEAIAPLSKLIQQPEFGFFAEVQLMLARSVLAVGQPSDALKILHNTPPVDSAHSLSDDVKLVAIESFFALNRFKAVDAAAGDFLKRYPKSELASRAAYYRILALMELERFALVPKAIASIDPSNMDALTQAHVLLLGGEAHERLGQSKPAIDLYGRVIDAGTAPYIAPARVAKARLTHANGNHDAALSAIMPLLDSTDADPQLVAAARLTAGRIAFEQKQLKKAMEHFKAVPIDAGEAFVEARFRLALCLLEFKEFENAALAFATIARDNPDSPWAPDALFNQAAALLQNESFDDVDAVLQSYVEKFPDHPRHPDAIHQRASLAHRRGDFAAALQLCNQFATRYADHPLLVDVRFVAADNLFLAEQLEPAAAQFASSYDDFPNDDRRDVAALRAGIAAYRLNRFDDAAHWLQKIPGDKSAANPMFAQAFFALGDIAFERQQWRTVIKWMDAFVAAKPDSPMLADAQLKTGIAARRISQPHRALEALDQLLKNDADSTITRRAKFERGMVLREMDKDAAAVAAFEGVLESDVDDELAGHARYQIALLAAKQGDHGRAEELLARGNSESTNRELDAESTIQRCASLMAMEKYDRASECYEGFAARFSKHPHAPSALAHRAIALGRQSRDAKSLAAIDRVLSDHIDHLDPQTIVQLRYEQAWCHKASGDESQAIASYRSIVSKSNDNRTLDRHAALELAELLSDRGETEEARRLLAKLVPPQRDSKNAYDEVQRRAVYRLGLCDFSDKNYDSSINRFAAVIERTDDEQLVRSSHYYLGESLFRIEKFADAAASFQIIVNSPSRDEAYRTSVLRLAEGQSKLQNWPQSRVMFERFVREFPDDLLVYEAHFGMGWSLEHEKQFDEAINKYRLVTQAHNGQTAARAQFQIGECLFAQGKHESAVVEFLKIDIHYVHPEWTAAGLFEAGRCFEQLNKIAEARQQFQSVIDRFGDGKWAKLASERISQMHRPAIPGQVSSRE